MNFPEAEYHRFIRIITDLDPLIMIPSNLVEIGFLDVTERDRHRIGEVVDVEFSTTGPIDEFFTGAQLFRWDGVKKAYETSTAS